MDSQEYFDQKNLILYSMNDGKCKHIYERNKHFSSKSSLCMKIKIFKKMDSQQIALR